MNSSAADTDELKYVGVRLHLQKYFKEYIYLVCCLDLYELIPISCLLVNNLLDWLGIKQKPRKQPP